MSPSRSISILAGLCLTGLAGIAHGDTRYFRAFVPGYITNLGIEYEQFLPETCEEWQETPLDTPLGSFELSLRSNIPFSTNIEFPAERVRGGVCAPVIGLNTNEAAYTVPITIAMQINNEDLVEFSRERSSISTAFEDKFEQIQGQCQRVGQDQWSGRPTIEQLERATFKGIVKFTLRSDFDLKLCDDDPEYSICSCDRETQGAAAVTNPVLPLISASIAPTEEGQRIAETVDSAINLQNRCDAIIQQLTEAETPLTRRTVPQDCHDRVDFDKQVENPKTTDN